MSAHSDMVKQQKAWEKDNKKKWAGSDEHENMGGGILSAVKTPATKKVAPTQPELVMDKTVVVKRPGPKVQFYGRNDGLIAWCMQRAGVRYSKAKIRYSEYIRLGKQPGRKKARGYWQFTIQYAA